MNGRTNKTYYGLVFFSLVACSVYADNQIIGAPSWSTPARGIGLEGSITVKGDTEPLFDITGSTKVYTQRQIDEKFNAPDWFPNKHDKMPNIVRSGKAPKVWACASCHLASGSGHPESASLAGLDSSYLQAQMAAFSDDSRLDYSGHMNRMAKELTNTEIKEISDWFSRLTPRKVTKVVETAYVLKTYVDGTRMRLVAQPHLMKEIANRIIEIPDNVVEVKKRNPASMFISYVPNGSIARGKDLVNTGRGKTIPCTNCHGANLAGNTIGPAIIGNFASYTVRQLYGFKGGTRTGGNSAMMLGVVDALTDKDIVDISAYLASLPVN
jgi:cytochrome c553